MYSIGDMSISKASPGRPAGRPAGRSAAHTQIRLIYWEELRAALRAPLVTKCHTRKNRVLAYITGIPNCLFASTDHGLSLRFLEVARSHHTDVVPMTNMPSLSECSARVDGTRRKHAAVAL